MEHDILGADLLAVAAIARDPLVLDVHARNAHHLHSPPNVHILVMPDEGKVANAQQEPRQNGVGDHVAAARDVVGDEQLVQNQRARNEVLARGQVVVVPAPHVATTHVQLLLVVLGQLGNVLLQKRVIHNAVGIGLKNVLHWEILPAHVVEREENGESDVVVGVHVIELENVPVLLILQRNLLITRSGRCSQHKNDVVIVVMLPALRLVADDTPDLEITGATQHQGQKGNIWHALERRLLQNRNRHSIRNGGVRGESRLAEAERAADQTQVAKFQVVQPINLVKRGLISVRFVQQFPMP